jgi:hypothetical protein
MFAQQSTYSASCATGSPAHCFAPAERRSCAAFGHSTGDPSHVGDENRVRSCPRDSKRNAATTAAVPFASAAQGQRCH